MYTKRVKIIYRKDKLSPRETTFVELNSDHIREEAIAYCKSNGWILEAISYQS